MYLPKHFEQHDPAALAALMRDHPLATLVTVQSGEPTADHIPLEFDAATQTLRGHVARANPLWRVADGQAVLAVFCDAQAYVSPSWYPSKAETHKVCRPGITPSCTPTAGCAPSTARRGCTIW